MPLYEYECESCGRRVERIQRFSDPPLTTCETCGGPLRKLLSSPAIQFKGSGWYITDYARKPDTGGAKKSDDGGKTVDGAGPDAPTPKEPASKETTAKPATAAAKKSDERP
jgi:putative FmdB family regulatory protein